MASDQNQLNYWFGSPGLETRVTMPGGGPGRMMPEQMLEGMKPSSGTSPVARYQAALASGQITKPEYDAFMQALNQNQAQSQAQSQMRGQGTPAFPDKPSARAALNSSSRTIDRFWAKHQASHYEGGPALTPDERSQWQNAFRTKQNAQQYLESTQSLQGFE
jgi:hypothetical protein